MAELNQDDPYAGALQALGGIDQRLANLQDLSAQDQAQGQEGMATGLNLSPDTGGGGFDPSVFRRGLDAITPSQETMGRIFAGLEAAGAHLQGRTPLFMQMQEQQANLQLKREQMAMQIAQHQQQQQEHQFTQAFQVMSNKELPWSQKKKMLASDPGNPYARLFQHVGDESLAADFENIIPYLDQADIEAFQKNPDEFTRNVGGIAGVEAKLKLAQERQKATIKEREHQRYTQTLFDKYNKDPQSLNETEFEDLNKIVSARKDREAKQKELDLKIKQIDQDIRLKGAMPKEVYSGVRGEGGDVVTGIFNPATMQTTEMSGVPLQRTKDMSAPAMEKVIDERAVLQQIKTVDELFQKDFVGPIDNLKAWAKETAPGVFGPISGEEEKFRKVTNQIVTNARRIDAGTAQSVHELAQLAKTYPDLSQHETVFGPALEAMRERITARLQARSRLAAEIAAGRQKPLSLSERAAQLATLVSAPGFAKTPDDAKKIAQDILREELQLGIVKVD